jgi:hypothetical protein
MIRIRVLSAVLACTVFGWSQNHYVCAPETCTGRTIRDGSDWKKAWDKLPANLVRGHTYYVAKGTYPGHVFSDEPEGAISITVKAVTTADHGTATGWSDSYVGEATFKTDAGGGIFVFNHPYYVIDGQYRSSDEISGYGFHVNNYNGCTPVTSCSPDYSNNATVYLNSNNITVRYTEIDGSHDQRSNPCGSGHSCDPNFLDYGHGNILLEYDYIHDPGEANFHLRGSGTSNGSGGLVNFTVQHSYIARNWSQGGGLVHSESFSASDGIQNLVVRYNKFQDIRGTGVFATASGSCYNGCPNYNRGNGPWYIYGNLWWYTSPSISDCVVGGFVALWDVGFVGDVYIYNNTIANINDNFCPVGAGGDASVNGQGLETAHLGGNAVYVRNNLWVNSDGGVYLDLADGKVVEDNNKTVDGGSLFKDDAAHNYHLVRHTSHGVPLSNIDSQSFDLDMDGHLRRTRDIGAFEFVPVTPPAEPTR